MVIILSSILLLSLLAWGLNMVYIHMDQSTVEETDKFSRVPEGIKICNLGSSHGLYGFCYDDIDEEYTCFNFALSSQSLVYDEKILGFYQKNIAPNAVVFVPISDFSLFGKPEDQEKNFEARNKRYYNFLPESLITNYDKITGCLQNYPLLTAYEKTAAVFLGVHFSQESDMWSATADDIDLKNNVQESYMRHLVTDKLDENQKLIINEDNISALFHIIKRCRDIGARPVLITTPLLKEYTDTVRKNAPEFEKEFTQTLDAILSKTSVEYYNYSHDKRFSENHGLFFDGDHLNKNGAKKFVAILMEEIVKN